MKDTLTDIQTFRTDLLVWFDQYSRDLPWRHKGGAHPIPYHVWLSEIMLQQTTVQAVKSYFEKFIDIWPTLNDLANAKDTEIMDAWAGLGYYSRARNLHKCAKTVIEQHNGKFPEEEAALQSLPGIGPYTASAIASIALNNPSNVVDGNIERIMARLYTIQTPFPEGKKEAKEKAQSFVGSFEGRHSDYVQALMDLGATICTPKSPKCGSCPVIEHCMAYATNSADVYPKLSPKKVKPKRFGTVYIVRDDMHVYLERRPKTGLLANMLGFPTSEWKPVDAVEKGSYNVKHVFTHFELYLRIEQKTESFLQEGMNKGIIEKYVLKDLHTDKKLPTLFKKVLNQI